MMRALYSATGFLITPLLVRWLHRRARRGKEELSRMGERFGRASQPRPAGNLIWLHAASVGETQSVLTLVRALLRQHPQLHVLITTGTVTSAALVAQQHLPRTMHQFIPVDTAPAVRRFLQHWQPDITLWVESEFWPQLLWQTAARGTPILLINARITAASAARWQRFPRSIQSLLACFTGIYAGSPEDAARLTQMGAATIAHTGNLKYDAAPLTVDETLLATLREAIGPRPFWVAASTHANEEQIIGEVHQACHGQQPDLLTILVPRHATRGDSIAADLRGQGLHVAQRSYDEPITPRTDVYLADTMGELGTFYALADIVFLGGSLIAHGGHNPLEPARQSCAIITGEHTHNFGTIIHQFIAADAIRVVHDKTALHSTLCALLQNEATAAELAKRALDITRNSRGASDAILAHIAQLLPRSQP